MTTLLEIKNIETFYTLIYALRGVSLSVDEGTEYPEAQHKIVSGDTLIFYTDGITEATNEAGEQYGYSRLLDCVTEEAPNAQHIVDCIYHKVLAFTGNAPAYDDQTLLAMRVE